MSGPSRNRRNKAFPAAQDDRYMQAGNPALGLFERAENLEIPLNAEELVNPSGVGLSRVADDEGALGVGRKRDRSCQPISGIRRPEGQVLAPR